VKKTDAKKSHATVPLSVEMQDPDQMLSIKISYKEISKGVPCYVISSQSEELFAVSF
jgi:hypothetical protein